MVSVAQGLRTRQSWGSVESTGTVEVLKEEMRSSCCATRFKKVKASLLEPSLSYVFSLGSVEDFVFISSSFNSDFASFPSRWHRGSFLLVGRLGGQRLLLSGRRSSSGGHSVQDPVVLQHVCHRVCHRAHAAAQTLRPGSQRTHGLQVPAWRQGWDFLFIKTLFEAL